MVLNNGFLQNYCFYCLIPKEMCATAANSWQIIKKGYAEGNLDIANI